MTYELAKKLKEEGFPQKGQLYCKHDVAPLDGIHYIRNYKLIPYENICDSIYVIKPTLSELIEACGGAIFSILNLHRTDGAHQKQVDEGNNWGVMGFNKEEQACFCYGETIEEAVANLWLQVI